MTVPVPLERYKQYELLVIDGTTTDFQLRKIVIDLTKDAKSAPSTAEIKVVLGVALFRLGKQDDGLAQLRTAFRMGAKYYENLVLALSRRGDYEEALRIRLEADTAEQWTEVLPLILLTGDFSPETMKSLSSDKKEVLGQIVKAGLDTPLKAVLDMLVGEDSYGVNDMEFCTDWDNGELIVDIILPSRANPENVAHDSMVLSHNLVKRFDSNVLGRIIPQLEAVEDGS